MPEQLVTVKQAAQILALTQRKARDLCLQGVKRGGLGAIRIGAQWRIAVSELDRFIKSKEGRS